MDSVTNPSRSVLRNSLILGVFAVCTVGLIAITQQGTEERIIAEQQRMQMRALNEILPDDQHDNDLLDDAFSIDDRKFLGLPAPATAWRGRQAGAVSAVILPVVTMDGYSGRIDLLVGIQANGELAGVRVINHRETPGLGDKLEVGKSSWVFSFDGKSLSMPTPDGWAVRKDGGEFDQFTGATITPRAVVQAVHKALEYFSEHRDTLLQLTPEEAAHG
ncbi:electron transport complex protein RnfG [Halopseudomonas litoralis]|uniref:Ion-translocating oxidoreductase complex subunit G n=1 Tax=Halopseudomonas litoralis TaxID=797277 RepID=A0A1H1P291_9GAMM|nr:electron transport complex subunit RsxG [Halopseudomonas litoralis]SDS05302.1 electron transport complex protein RnfG [Halopseudomonas litoralis]